MIAVWVCSAQKETGDTCWRSWSPDAAWAHKLHTRKPERVTTPSMKLVGVTVDTSMRYRMHVQQSGTDHILVRTCTAPLYSQFLGETTPAAMDHMLGPPRTITTSLG